MKTDKFLVPEFGKVDLKDHPTDYTGDYKDKSEAAADLAKNIEKMAKLQDVLYAQNIHSLLIVFQAMDAAGKDSVIKHVMSGVNPQGCQVKSFKVPSAEERDHDFLWRSQVALPERGMIGIFNRSHYEEVLVVRVHKAFLEAEQLPDDIKHDPDIWKKRFQQIRDWEDMLAANGTHVIKFFLHVSKDEQKKRFLERIERPDKNWKFNSTDAKERAFWKDYMAAYCDAMENTSTKKSPWYVIPADKKWFTRLAVSEVIVEKLESLDLKYPKVTDAMKADLVEAKDLLNSEG
jgi:PPK2 family polyphosphate:nucleotide phosphotransferase